MSKYNLRNRNKKEEKTDNFVSKIKPTGATMQSTRTLTEHDTREATSAFENGASGGGSIPDTTKDTIDEYFRKTTASFQTMIRDAMESLLDNVRRVEAEMGKLIEFESRRIDDLEKENKSLGKKVGSMKKEIDQLQDRVLHLEADINKGERFSRRNNFRVVGVKENQEPAKEDCVSFVEKMLRDKFGMEVKVERAHRDGAKRDNKPRHILVKTLSYRDKTQVMKSAREKLRNAGFFIVDDLTKKDLEEKRKWAENVKVLYSNGTKLRFYAGKWRGNAGEPYKFT